MAQVKKEIEAVCLISLLTALVRRLNPLIMGSDFGSLFQKGRYVHLGTEQREESTIPHYPKSETG